MTGGSTSEGGEGGFGADIDRAGHAGSSAPTGGASEAGRGGTGTGGSNVAGTSGGGAPLGGNSGTTNTGGAAAAAGSAGTAPEGWTCLSLQYGDGESCDCGCGVTDSDCDDESIESCDECHLLGGCGNGACPSNVDPDDNGHCIFPAAWVCGESDYGDGLCDCGCGVLDVDCPSDKGEDCDSCPVFGCSRDLCSTIDPEDNRICTVAPTRWTCPERLYHDGLQCDCGCGYFDPDCAGHAADDCDNCNSEGSCSGQACPGLIEPEANDGCFKPVPPAGWTCEAAIYGDARDCNCGCGVPDPDCRDALSETCDDCAGCSYAYCPESLDPNDTTKCAPPPADWTCNPSAYADGRCDCGCNAMDIDCRSNLYCQHCNGCSHGDCARIDQNDITQCTYRVPDDWTCSIDVYWDDVCDCGCGVIDVDCLSANRSDCDICDGEGSCSDVACRDPESTILPDDNTSCSE